MAIRIFESAEQVAGAAADVFVATARGAVESGRLVHVALSGGSTPVRLFKLLAAEPYRDAVPWQRVHFFWGDERTVPPDHPDSNFGAANEALLSKLELPRENVHRIHGEHRDPEEAAADYEVELRRHFGLADGEFPCFDLVYLGMGADGHTASLFPGSEALAERRRLAVAHWVERLGAHRITLTCPTFNSASCILLLVTGGQKAETLREVLEGPAEPPRYPVQLIRPEGGELHWYIDNGAARLLGRESP
ncbi:MAG: 6-phosphogluconolactonase [Gemmatimonadetes bacterium]|nr:6-phosphogluconolactonase [Gemmatimonadota bacterium]NIO30533.1 6-phosphogluconolactonase [Gemmatimonadota bacterium]